MILDKSGILSAMKLKTETVPFGDGEVIVSEIAAMDYIKLWTESSVETGEKDNEGNPITKIDMSKFTPALLAYSIVDEKGNRLFDDAECSLISRSSHEPFLKLAEVAKRMNGLIGDEGND